MQDLLEQPGETRITTGDIAAFVFLATATIGAMLALYLVGEPAVGRYFTFVNPLVGTVVVLVVGFVAFRVLVNHFGFHIAPSVSLSKWLGSIVGAGLLFSLPAIGADLVWRYPEDINVGLPEALLFYPAIGFVAEIVFHVVPLAVLLLILGAVFHETDNRKLTLTAILLVSTVEAVFQVAEMSASADPNTALSVFTGAHLFLFGLAQLLVFRRWGFVPTYTLRLVYYAVWHIAWGAARLA